METILFWKKWNKEQLKLSQNKIFVSKEDTTIVYAYQDAKNKGLNWSEINNESIIIKQIVVIAKKKMKIHINEIYRK